MQKVHKKLRNGPTALYCNRPICLNNNKTLTANEIGYACHVSQLTEENIQIQDKKPCCCKETVRCCSCSFPFKVRRRHYKFKCSRASKALGEMGLGKMGLGELGLGEMGQNRLTGLANYFQNSRICLP